MSLSRYTERKEERKHALMTKKSSSFQVPFAKGNSETLCDAFQKGAEEAGYQVEKVSLAGKQLAFCQGCLSCQERGTASFMMMRKPLRQK